MYVLGVNIQSTFNIIYLTPKGHKNPFPGGFKESTKFKVILGGMSQYESKRILIRESSTYYCFVVMSLMRILSQIYYNYILRLSISLTAGKGDCVHLTCVCVVLACTCVIVACICVVLACTCVVLACTYMLLTWYLRAPTRCFPLLFTYNLKSSCPLHRHWRLTSGVIQSQSIVWIATKVCVKSARRGCLPDLKNYGRWNTFLLNWNFHRRYNIHYEQLSE